VQQGDPAAEEAARQDYVRCRGDKGSIDVFLRPEPSGVLAATLVTSLVTAALLWVIQGRLAELDVQTGSGLLLVLPVVVVAYLARQGEHAFATRLLVGVRTCALVVGLCALAVAALIGVATIDRTVPSPLPQPATVFCDAENQRFGRPARRASELRTLHCTTPAAAPERPARSTENETAQGWARIAAVVASVMAGILLVGFLRTWMSDFRSRGRAGSYSES
jgi:hypothetical protein